MFTFIGKKCVLIRFNASPTSRSWEFDLQQQLSNEKKTCCLALERCCFRYNTKFGADVWMYWYRIGAMLTLRAFVVVHSNRCQQSYDSECSTVMVLRVQMPIMNSMILYYQKSVLILLYSNCIKINVEVWSILCTLYYWISPRYCFVRLSFDLFERTNFFVWNSCCYHRMLISHNAVNNNNNNSLNVKLLFLMILIYAFEKSTHFIIVVLTHFTF